jgi:hypothetical protein
MSPNVPVRPDAHDTCDVGVTAPPGSPDAPNTPETRAAGSEPPHGHSLHDAQGEIPVGDHTPAEATSSPSPNLTPLLLVDPLLSLLAETLDDLERVRIAEENRFRHLTRSVEDSDGEVRGLGLSEADAPVAAVAAIVTALNGLEQDATKQLQKALRKHPLGPWVKAQKGVGDKQAARLLAAVGDPYWHTLHGRPRTVSELWAYCGLHVIKIPVGQSNAEAQRVGADGDSSQTGQAAPGVQVTPAGLGSGSHPDTQSSLDTQDAPSVGVAPTRKRGERMNWSGDAKMRTYLIAEACMKQLGAGCKELGDNRHLGPDSCTCGYFRTVYDYGRLKYADSIHLVDCKRCGPSGKPALAGSDLSPGHQHARAMRLVMKELLKEMWREAKRLHEEAAA